MVVFRCAKVANGKSLAGLLKLGVKHGGTIRISAQGPEADAALAALKKLVEAGEEEEQAPAGPAHGWAPRAAGESVPGVAASPGLAIGPLRRRSWWQWFRPIRFIPVPGSSWRG